jgi:RNA polymerase sigma-70 factor (ECF subfamily)
MAVYTRRGVERSRVEDLVADVYATAWRRFEDLPVDRERTAEWLFGVARHVYLNLCRSERRQAALAERLARVGDPVAHGQPDEARWRLLRSGDRCHRPIVMSCAW